MSSTATIFRSDDGLTFTSTVFTRSHTIASAVRYAPTNSDRVYATGWFYRPSATWIFRSDDGGQTFVERAHVLPDSGTLELLAVSPVDQELILVRSGGIEAEYLYRSSDSGDSLSLVLTSTLAIRDATFSEDGRTVWVSSTARMFRSEDSGRTFELMPSPVRNACTGMVGGDLWVCGWPWIDHFAVGRQEPAGAFEGAWNLDEIRGILECPAASPIHQFCEPIWPLVKSQLGIDDPPPPTEPGCDCRARRSKPNFFEIAGLISCLVLLGRCRRPRRKFQK
ncbi:MAG: hypothetical protein HY791_34525 [Deltaproteobacteria bacterium]|nr:hypothetical protein [Deltaproteobacteria bacterium]